MSCKIIFMGTPEFSVPALEALAGEEGFDIALVVTQPDRPKGRGKKLAPSPVKEKALELGLELYQPERINTPESIALLEKFAPDYFVVVAYGQVLSSQVLSIPKVYPINIHASLLPKYRGAAPIQAAVLNMDNETGVTTMVMAKGLDTGDMLLKDKTPVDPEDTAETLHDRLSAMGANLIVTTIHRLNEGTLTPEPQDDTQASYVPMLKKSDGVIDFHRSAKAVCAHINAMTPWPGAFTALSGKRLKIFKARPGQTATNAAPGEILSCDKEGICVAVEDGTVVILELMGNSGKRMTADAFLRGNPIELPARFTTP